MEEFNDNRLKALLKDSKVEMPFSDFESKLMMRVRSERNSRRSIVRNIRLSWVFFTIGSVFGLFLNILVPNLSFKIGGFELQYFKYLLFAVTLFVIIWQLDEMIKLTSRQKKPGRNT
jgi:hypothetical protein